MQVKMKLPSNVTQNTSQPTHVWILLIVSLSFFGVYIIAEGIVGFKGIATMQTVANESLSWFKVFMYATAVTLQVNPSFQSNVVVPPVQPPILGDDLSRRALRPPLASTHVDDSAVHE